MLAIAQRPEPTAMLNHRGERIMPLPYSLKCSTKLKTRKLSVMEGDCDPVHPLSKKQRNEYNLEPEMEMEPMIKRQDTPFDLHLQAVYEGNAEDGLQFFQSHGYYDINDANTVEMFRQNFGLDEGFWLDQDDQEFMVEPLGPAVYPFGFHLEITSSRNLLSRKRSDSGRFMVLDEEGNEVDEHTLWEMEREDRLKAKSLDLDEDDLAELAHDEVVMVQAIRFIRTEKIQLQQFFLQVFQDETPSPRLHQSEIMSPLPSVDIDLPPYCGYVNVLKDTIPFLMRSWHKRWFYLDFQAGVVLMYKRSYWKSPRGFVDLRHVAQVAKMSQGDFRIEFHDTGSDAPAMMLLRSKTPEEAELWVNLLRFAKHASRHVPRLTELMDNSKALMKRANKKNQADILAQLLQNSANNARSSNLRAIAQASAVAASAVCSRRNAKHRGHFHAITA